MKILKISNKLSIIIATMASLILDTVLSELNLLAAYPQNYEIEGDTLIQVAPIDPLSTPLSGSQSPEKLNFIYRKFAVINSFSSAAVWTEQETICTLFFKHLSSWDYDRGKIAAKSRLEYALDPELYFAHHEDDVDPVTGRKIHETVREALLAIRLGVKPEKADSAFHEAYYLLNRSEQRIGVFKPGMTRSFLNDSYGGSEDREAHLAEVANSQLDVHLETRLVPHTEPLTCRLPLPSAPQPITGSFQFYVAEPSFLETHLEGESFFNTDYTALKATLNTEANRKLKISNFENFALFDLLTANNDHHFRNILRKATGELVAIDNANSFPWCHERNLPFYKMRPLHTFKWRALPHATHPFSQSTIDKINTLHLPTIEAILRTALIDENVPSSLEHFQGKIRTLRERIQTLKTLANEGAPISEIAEAILQLSNQPSRCESLTGRIRSLWQRFISPILTSETAERFLAKVF